MKTLISLNSPSKKLLAIALGIFIVAIFMTAISVVMDLDAWKSVIVFGLCFILSCILAVIALIMQLIERYNKLHDELNRDFTEL